jgi:hypothetical protein
VDLKSSKKAQKLFLSSYKFGSITPELLFQIRVIA